MEHNITSDGTVKQAVIYEANTTIENVIILAKDYLTYKIGKKVYSVLKENKT